jgi:hypothetical protein
MARQFRRKKGALRGASKVRRLIKQLPGAVNVELVKVYEEQAPIVQAYQRAAAPGRSIAGTLSYKIFPKTLRLRMGMLKKQDQRDKFYARILEFGRKPQTVTVKRRLKGGGVSVYSLRVKAISASRYDFVLGRAGRFAFAKIRPELNRVYERALKRAAFGVTD